MNSTQNSISWSECPEQSFEKTVVDGLSENAQITLETVCDVKHDSQTYPILLVRSQSIDAAKPTVFLSAGTHGDEPAGVHAIIRFLNNDLHKFTKRFNVVALPCLNPTGFDTNVHNTAEGVNLNDHFGKPTENAVVQAVEAKITSIVPSIVLAFDLHEDNSGDRECYVYESVSENTQRIAHQVLQVLAPAKICREPKIYDDANHDGVIEKRVNESIEVLGGLDEYLKRHGAEHVMTIETPAHWKLEDRIQAHLKMILRGIESI